MTPHMLRKKKKVRDRVGRKGNGKVRKGIVEEAAQIPKEDPKRLGLGGGKKIPPLKLKKKRLVYVLEKRVLGVACRREWRLWAQRVNEVFGGKVTWIL